MEVFIIVKEVWDCTISDFVNMPAEMVAFLSDIVEICKKHNLSISHEDDQGAFIIERYCEHNVAWLLDAQKGY
jgi:hypothetical protein